MPLWIIRGILFLALASQAPQLPSASTSPPAASSIGGVWVLNPSLTRRPDEIGFNPAWARAAGSEGDTGRSGGRRGRRGGSSSSGAGIESIAPESADDSTRMQQLTAEARTPPAHLTIVQRDSSVSMADDQGLARTFHPNGAVEDLTLGTVPLPTTARWDAGSLVVVYDVESGRQVRYTYTPSANPKRLQVDITFIDRKREGDQVHLTYEPPDAQSRAAVSPSPTAATSASAAAAPSATTPAAPAPALPPGSELRGLNSVAVDVEDLSAEAAACGLDQMKMKNAISKALTDGGLKIETSGREDADVVVSVATSKLPSGICVSRYDASVVSYADAKLPYVHGTVAAVEVQLLHDGGLAGGSPASHAAAVVNALTKSVNQFVARIQAANK